jgi:hypothetical protein
MMFYQNNTLWDRFKPKADNADRQIPLSIRTALLSFSFLATLFFLPQTSLAEEPSFYSLQGIALRATTISTQSSIGPNDDYFTNQESSISKNDSSGFPIQLIFPESTFWGFMYRQLTFDYQGESQFFGPLSTSAGLGDLEAGTEWCVENNISLDQCFSGFSYLAKPSFSLGYLVGFYIPTGPLKWLKTSVGINFSQIDYTADLLACNSDCSTYQKTGDVTTFKGIDNALIYQFTFFEFLSASDLFRLITINQTTSFQETNFGYPSATFCVRDI